MSEHILLVCTVGGSPEPISTSLIHWEPDRILFVPSRLTAEQLDSVLEIAGKSFPHPLQPGMYEVMPVDDPQDFTECVGRMRLLAREAEAWLARGEEFRVIVDFTGGTKCMSAALVLVMHTLPCRFSYVGGTERTKDGVGIVVCGHEQIVHAQNPWNTLGMGAVAEAIVLFNEREFTAAERTLDAVLRGMDEPSLKRSISALMNLARGYSLWDRFQHGKAASALEKVVAGANDLAALFGEKQWSRLDVQIREHRRALEALAQSQGACGDLVTDLITNAQRRAEEGRFDDAVARLYRAIEACAQACLMATYKIDAGDLDVNRLSDALKGKWQQQHKLALQDAYELLNDLGDELGVRFIGLGLKGPKSSLSSRNQSILAHGFSSVGEKVYQNLLKSALELSNSSPDTLPQFPVLPKLL